MDLKLILSNFIIFSALALNIEFVLGDAGSIELHNSNILFAAIVFNILATINKLGETNSVGNLIIASSILSLIQLIISSCLWFYFNINNIAINSLHMTEIVNISIGALFFNFLSVIMLIIQTVKLKR